MFRRQIKGLTSPAASGGHLCSQCGLHVCDHSGLTKVYYVEADVSPTMKNALGGKVTLAEPTKWGKFEFGVTTDGTLGVVFTAVCGDNLSGHKKRVNYGWVHDGPQCDNIKDILVAGHAVFGVVTEFVDCSAYGGNNSISTFHVLFGLSNKDAMTLREVAHVQGLTVPIDDIVALGPAPYSAINEEPSEASGDFQTVSTKDSDKVILELMKNNKRKAHTLEKR
ncbi:hypothetical protein BJ508DRAFT_334271, partial [Ascobolus immersus RN42]